jgi:hypothetical protein
MMRRLSKFILALSIVSAPFAFAEKAAIPTEKPAETPAAEDLSSISEAGSPVVNAANGEVCVPCLVNMVNQRAPVNPLTEVERMLADEKTVFKPEENRPTGESGVTTEAPPSKGH